MLFNTIEFAVFFSIVIFLLFFIRKINDQKYIYLVVSYVFYAWWNPVFIFLLVISTVVNYFFGQSIYSGSGKKKRGLFYISIFFNIGLLIYFKYINFFSDTFQSLLHLLGGEPSWVSVNVILPLGISFYTFEAIGYLIDIYRDRYKPSEKLIDFAVFMAFFPRLLSGPIMRANDFIPQLGGKKRVLDFSTINLLLFFKGIFKKVVIADNLGSFANSIFETPERYPSLVIYMAAVCFTIQIYCDFSGYTDMAIALASIMGFKLPINFNKPLFALTPSDYWRRWHISLSSWMSDYIYKPLGGSKSGDLMTYRNILITMAISGLWHGASWNFVIWGVFHGIISCIYKMLRVDEWIFKKDFFSRALAWGILFLLNLVAWLIFRISDFDLMKIALVKVLYPDFYFSFSDLGLGDFSLFTTIILIGTFVCLETYSYFVGNLEIVFSKFQPSLLLSIIFIATIVYYFFIPTTESPFIYFQF